MGWLIALGILILIAILPVGIRAFYDSDGFRLYVSAGPANILVFPGKKKEKKTKESKSKNRTPKKSAPKPKSTKKGGSYQDFFPLVDKVLDFLSAFRRKLRIKNLTLKMILAGGEPADLAMNYGKAWAALGNLIPLLERAFVIKKRNLEVECDYLADTITLIARVDISITVGRVISLLLVQGIPILREFLKIMNKRKGGAKA